MNRPVSPEELSALLDGELSAERASEIHLALLGDAVLRSEYEQLAELDRHWSAATSQARFQFSIQPFVPGLSPRWGMGLAALALLNAIRTVTKLPVSSSLAVVLHGIALGALLVAVTRLVLQSKAGSSLGRNVIQPCSDSSQ
jgi:hypothetical protein